MGRRTIRAHFVREGVLARVTYAYAIEHTAGITKGKRIFS